ncbi:Mmp37-domain-containing protein [Tuber magnatum]|uniref:Phosphatidate cytidylyltransferase, mitochondrial n=1 Tax=Tuber magnatum TaxID=42249 RepID=A0A317SM46_9PEZI|nr:Mmp37-domain-containing protein [Tuber magnatum]
MIPRHLARTPRLHSFYPSGHLRQYRNLSFSTSSPTPPNDNGLNTKLPPPPLDFDEPDLNLSSCIHLPPNFGTNQHMHVDDALKDRLRSLLWQFRAPVRYAFAYGSGVFPQGSNFGSSSVAGGNKPMIDLIFGVTYTQHWHSLNLAQHGDHYSFLGKMGSAVISHVQDDFGAGVYFNPYVDVGGTLIKYGVVNLATLIHDLRTWDTLYLAGRLQKPVKILRDDPQVRLVNQHNLLSAIRTALLLLPAKFTEHDLYTTIAGISYTGDPRMKLYSENPHKVNNIVRNQLPHFRRLYSPLVEQLPNVQFLSQGVTWNDLAEHIMLEQDMDPQRRANIIHRLPKSFREKVYFQYQRKFAIPALDFEKMVGRSADEERMLKREGGEFERRIAMDSDNVGKVVGGVIKTTIGWPSTIQSLKGVVTAGPLRSWRYLKEKIGKWSAARKTVVLGQK